MERDLQKAVGGWLVLLGTAALILPMVLLSEQPGQWMIWTGGGVVVIGLTFIAPTRMDRIVSKAQEAVPFLDGGEDA